MTTAQYFVTFGLALLFIVLTGLVRLPRVPAHRRIVPLVLYLTLLIPIALAVAITLSSADINSTTTQSLSSALIVVGAILGAFAIFVVESIRTAWALWAKRVRK